MSLSRTEWTAAMLSTLPDDGQRYEIIDGELYVTPAPSIVHQRAIARLHLLLHAYVERLGQEVLFAPFAVTFSAQREVQPDVLVLPRQQNGRRASKFADVGRLLLAAEVLSPTSLRTDRREKRRLYQQEGVAEYWIVDTDARTFERWTPNATEPEVLRQSLSWQLSAAHEPQVIDLEKFFRDVLDE